MYSFVSSRNSFIHVGLWDIRLRYKKVLRGEVRAADLDNGGEDVERDEAMPPGQVEAGEALQREDVL